MSIMIFIRRLAYMLFALIHNFIGIQKGVYVLCYHSISDDGWRFSTTRMDFLRHISFIHKKYSFIDTVDFEQHTGLHKEMNSPSFLLTFDDGYKNILSIADDLKSYDIRPIVFLLGEEERLNRKEMDNELDLLLPDDVRKLLSYGWSIGSHSLTHSQLNQLTEHEIRIECERSKKALEDTYGVRVDAFAYPKGLYSEKVIRSVMNAGYLYAFSMDDSKLSPNSNRFAYPRIGIDGSHTLYEFKGTITPSAIYFRRVIRTLLQFFN